EAALKEWLALTELTTGLYSDLMVFGPHDHAHCKHRLPYVRHDLETIAEHECVWADFGRFDFGFDFGGPTSTPVNVPVCRREPYLWRHTLAPRFELATSETAFSTGRGFGWAGAGDRQARALPSKPCAELRSAVRDPQHLPRNVRYGDWIEGRGAQSFRVRAGPGRFLAFILTPGGNSRKRLLEARDDHVEIVFPEGEWRVSGIVLRREPPQAAPALPPLPKTGPRPMMVHVPPKYAVAGQPLKITLRVSPIAQGLRTRLHYRPFNLLARFKTLELQGSQPVFVIPAEDVTSQWDLVYCFEIPGQHGGWFHPDPHTATPYWVVSTVPAATGGGSAN
ncbi:MAG: hypothetical protein NZ554_06725, partial [Bryobacteraceae bacterium]|nr:hypothetical protein [Bryobacteraceae bacterium]